MRIFDTNSLQSKLAALATVMLVSSLPACEGIDDFDRQIGPIRTELREDLNRCDLSAFNPNKPAGEHLEMCRDIDGRPYLFYEDNPDCAWTARDTSYGVQPALTPVLLDNPCYDSKQNDASSVQLTSSVIAG